jgi:hypothetical protein
MDKKLDKAEENKSDYVPPESVINEVIKSLESVDRKLKEFYEIHGNEMQVNSNNRPNLRRLK